MRSLIIAAAMVLGQGVLFAQQPDIRKDEGKVSTAAIYNARRVGEQLLTAGQPTAEQLRAAAAEGFQSVINLAPNTASNALKEEPELVRSLNMQYINIPVDWQAPTLADFAAFEQAMQTTAEKKTLVHCAANYRVSAFYSLYARKHLGWSKAKAEEFRRSIWAETRIPVWENFITTIEAQLPP